MAPFIPDSSAATYINDIAHGESIEMTATHKSGKAICVNLNDSTIDTKLHYINFSLNRFDHFVILASISNKPASTYRDFDVHVSLVMKWV